MALRSIGTTDTLETFRTTTNSHISDVGDLASLDTTEKGSIVGAINEVNTAGGNWNISDSTSTIENMEVVKNEPRSSLFFWKDLWAEGRNSENKS